MTSYPNKKLRSHKVKITLENNLICIEDMLYMFSDILYACFTLSEVRYKKYPIYDK